MYVVRWRWSLLRALLLVSWLDVDGLGTVAGVGAVCVSLFCPEQADLFERDLRGSEREAKSER